MQKKKSRNKIISQDNYLMHSYKESDSHCCSKTVLFKALTQVPLKYVFCLESRTTIQILKFNVFSHYIHFNFAIIHHSNIFSEDICSTVAVGELGSITQLEHYSNNLTEAGRRKVITSTFHKNLALITKNDFYKEARRCVFHCSLVKASLMGKYIKCSDTV